MRSARARWSSTGSRTWWRRATSASASRRRRPGGSARSRSGARPNSGRPRSRRGGRAASEGGVGQSVHSNGKIGVLAEVDCETDFVARTDAFREFAREVALHVAAAAPLYVADDEVPAEDREREQRIFAEQAAADGKPEQVQEKIAAGRMEKGLGGGGLLRQKPVEEGKDGRPTA